MQRGYWWSLPVVAETWDGDLNDVNGFHVKAAHVDAALDGAKAGPVEEGNVGGGTGMICHEFKCGIGTASRRVDVKRPAAVVGVLVQANYGLRAACASPASRSASICTMRDSGRETAARATMARSSSSSPPTRRCCRTSSNASRSAPAWGWRAWAASPATARATSSSLLDRERGADGRQAVVAGASSSATTPRRLFEATVQATEEAIVNAMVAARDMQGNDGQLREGAAARRS